MKSIKGVDRMFLSGARVTFTLKKGAKLDEKVLRAAVKKNKLTFVSLSSSKRLPAKAAYVIKTPGLT
jgi:hypothetical protein